MAIEDSLPCSVEDAKQSEDADKWEEANNSELQKTLEWIESHVTVEILPDYCDPDSGTCYGKSLRGWTSPHLTDAATSGGGSAGPQAWSTAQATACITRFKAVVQTLRHVDVLNEFQGVGLSKKGVTTTAWDRLLDSDLGQCDGGMEGQPCTLKQVLFQRMIASRLESSSSTTTTTEQPLVTSYSAILFGPPGE